jgi:DHA2 family multidrug resistance protein
MTAYFMSHGVSDQAVATHKAVIAIALKLRKQANIMAFSDTFYLLGVALVVALLASLLLKKPGHLSGGGAH